MDLRPGAVLQCVSGELGRFVGFLRFARRRGSDLVTGADLEAGTALEHLEWQLLAAVFEGQFSEGHDDLLVIRSRMPKATALGKGEGTLRCPWY